MRNAQSICDELFMSKAFATMASGVVPYHECIIMARDFAGKLFPPEMLDNSELSVQEKIYAWGRV
jgi:hypothetical protein